MADTLEYFRDYLVVLEYLHTLSDIAWLIVLQLSAVSPTINYMLAPAPVFIFVFRNDLLKPGDLMKPWIILAVQVRLSCENMAPLLAPVAPLV